MGTQIEFTEDQKKQILEYIKKNIKKFVREGKKINIDSNDFLNSSRGVFVTIRNQKGVLRGCIGLPYPEQTLKEALVDASASATRDPRFSNIEEDELNGLEVEVTVLNEPEEIEVDSLDDVKSKIRLGKDGLIVKRKSKQGLLLPQVPLEHDMCVEEFLNHTCRKAGLSPGSWKKEDVKVLRFQGEVFGGVF